jgi:hypothetical protein
MLFIFSIFASTNCTQAPDNQIEKESSDDLIQADEKRQFYQLKTYYFETDSQVQITDAYLEKAFLPALKRNKIGPIGVFKPRPGADSLKKTFVLIPFSSIDQFLNLESLLEKDATYQAAGNEYITATFDQPPYQRIESVLLKAFQDMPVIKVPDLDGPGADRIYELRSYESATEKIFANKVDMFNAGGEIKLFEKLAFNAVFYSEVISGPKMPNLMYMTTHENQAARDANWDAFRKAPEWLEMKALPKYQKNVSHIDIHFLYPTEYSDY